MLILLLLAQALEYNGEKIEVRRDEFGIPHIKADTPRACYYGEGWAEAHDRLTQMDTWRRASRGRLAEIRGAESVNADIQARLHGYTPAEYDTMVGRLSADARNSMQAYADGVNAAIKALGRDVEPWTIADSISVAVMMARRFGAGGDLETRAPDLMNLLEKRLGKDTGRKVFDDFVRPSDPAAPNTLQSRLPSLRDYNDTLDAAIAHWQTLGVPTYTGSNAWVISGKRTRTGNPMLYGGPMMGFGAPSICNEIHIENKDFTAAGMSFPGLPCVVIGFNQKLAWTTTSGAGDNTDMFLLELNPANPLQYRYKGEWKDFDVREEEIKVKGAEPRKDKFYRTVYGPVIGKNYARCSTHWLKEGSLCEAFLDMSHAKTIDAFKAACSKIASSHNLFAIDADGNIGFWFCGLYPIRAKDHDPRLPPKGDGSQDWQGMMAFEDLPHAVNPERGYFANWNNKPSPTWTPFYQGKMFWGKKISDTLAADSAITFEKCWDLSKLTAYHAFTADYFKSYVLDAAAKDDAFKRAHELLSKWDNHYRENDPASALWNALEEKMIRRAFRDTMPPELWLAGKQIYRFLVDVLLYQLEGGKNLNHKYFDDPTPILQDAIKESLKALGEDESKWSWKEETIKMGEAGSFKSQKGRGTYMIAIEMTKEGPKAVSCFAPGASEDPTSPHYRDLYGLYSEWKSKPLK